MLDRSSCTAHMYISNAHKSYSSQSVFIRKPFKIFKPFRLLQCLIEKHPDIKSTVKYLQTTLPKQVGVDIGLSF